MSENTLLNETQNLLERVQKFDSNTLERADLSASDNFEEAVQPANEPVNLFQEIHTNELPELLNLHLFQLKNEAKGVLHLFNRVKEFNVQISGADHIRREILTEFVSIFDKVSYNLFR